MKQFTFAKLAKLGVMDEKYGQTYWGETNEQLEPVKFNSMNQEITDKDTIEAEEVLLKTSTKGTVYHQLKKVRVMVGRPALPVAEQLKVPREFSPILVQLDRIEEKLDKLLGVQQEAESDIPDFLNPDGGLND